MKSSKHSANTHRKYLAQYRKSTTIQERILIVKEILFELMDGLEKSEIEDVTHVLDILTGLGHTHFLRAEGAVDYFIHTSQEEESACRTKHK